MSLVKSFARALPEVVRTLTRIATDPALPRAAKVALAAALVYLLSPLDLLPDFMPVLGWIDDVLIGAVVVDGVLSYVDRALLLRYWPGSPDSLDKIARVARVLSAWVPRRLKQRMFAPGR